MLDRPNDAVDPLSDVLALVDARALFSAVFSAGDDWSVRFGPSHQGIKFTAVLQGRCWLAVDGVPPLRLETGDCYLLTRGRPYVLASDLTLPPVDFHEVGVSADGTLHSGVGSDVRLAGGRFVFGGSSASLLLELLPPVLHVGAGSESAGVLPWVLERLRVELAVARAGSALMAEYLANIMFVQMLRVHLATAPEGAGWLGALADEEIGRAIRRIHKEPTRRWTVNDLARTAGLSRSTFALRFKTSVGAAPLEYVLRWRVRLAEQALLSPSSTIATIADALGYESESAFSNAFKRVTGLAPSHYRAAQKTGRTKT